MKGSKCAWALSARAEPARWSICHHVALLRATAKHPEQAATSARTVRSKLVSLSLSAQHGKETGSFKKARLNGRYDLLVQLVDVLQR